jgi:hypothetical protein
MSPPHAVTLSNLLAGPGKLRLSRTAPRRRPGRGRLRAGVVRLPSPQAAMSSAAFLMPALSWTLRRETLSARATTTQRPPAAAVASPFPAKTTLADRVAALPPARGTIIVELVSPLVVAGGCRDTVVVNRDGKRASFRVFEAVARRHRGVFGKAAAKDALEVYGDVCFEAMAQRGRHPSIDWLFDVIAKDRKYVVKVDGRFVADDL